MPTNRYNLSQRTTRAFVRLALASSVLFPAVLFPAVTGAEEPDPGDEAVSAEIVELTAAVSDGQAVLTFSSPNGLVTGGVAPQPGLPPPVVGGALAPFPAPPVCGISADPDECGRHGLLGTVYAFAPGEGTTYADLAVDQNLAVVDLTFADGAVVQVSAPVQGAAPIGPPKPCVVPPAASVVAYAAVVNALEVTLAGLSDVAYSGLFQQICPPGLPPVAPPAAP
jgi:hypothetical protein